MKKYLIIAGEISGDLHGGNLVRAMRKLNPSIQFAGIGGENMRQAGVELLYHIEQLAFMGFAEVVKHIPFIQKVKSEIIEYVKNQNVKEIILIDFPGFNLSFAKDVKKFGVKIYYYISPQIWAWGKKRITKIRKLVDKMIVVFPFEEKIYRDEGIDAVFVGHPLLDVISSYKFKTKEEFFSENGFDPNKRLLVIFPGSRLQEIRHILPEVLHAAKKLQNYFDLNVAISGVNSIPQKVYDELNFYNFPILYGKNYELMKYSDAGIIKSGTSTLESAIFELPFVVVYKTSFLSYWISRFLIQIDKISLANIVAEEKIVDELIQKGCDKESIYDSVNKILENEDYRNSIKSKFQKVKEKLGTPGAAERAAKIILENF